MSLLIEEDEAGRIYRRYAWTSNSEVTVLNEPRRSEDHSWSKRIVQTFLNVFMPAGFPHSVSTDYSAYQLYDSLQAFSSSIAGLLASRAVLEGVGVGDANASATHALLLTITQDAVGRLATILFAWRIGTALEPEAKRYRLLADIFNDGAMILDCLSPALPQHIRLSALCISGSLRALCGVAAGGAKAALSVHFARSNNVGDLNAKDSSQETVIGLLGMLAGSFIVSRVTTQAATWSLLLSLLAIHLSMNYLAVCSVAMTTLNRQRANIIYNHFRTRKTVPSPTQVAKSERIFAAGGMLHHKAPGHPRASGWCRIGVDLTRLVLENAPLSSRIMNVFSHEQYILWISSRPSYPTTSHSYSICLGKESNALDYLKAWVHAMELAQTINETGAFYAQDERIIELLEQTLEKVNDIFPSFSKALTEAGWDVEKSALVTRPSFRISRTSGEDHKNHTESKKSR